MHPISLATYLVAGWSGYFVMALELLGARAMSPYFGSGIYVWGAIITVFMLSLSIGYLLGGRLSLKRASTRMLGVLLLAAVASAIPCVLLSEVLLEFVFTRVNDPRYGALLASILLFFAPITFCGAISPYAVRLIVANLGSSGQTAGLVFFVSTLGSTLGTLLTSFYMVLWFEVDQILIGMSVISVVVAANALRLGNRSLPPAVALLAAAAFCALPVPSEAREVFRKRSLYRDILVYESDGQRCMKFGIHDAGRQSCMSLANPNKLVFDYTKMLLGALYINPNPQRILVIGLGGGTVPGALQALLPAATIDCVEIDPAVADVAARFFNFQPARNTKVHIQDGRVFVKRAGQKRATYDLIILDAFDHMYVPEHLLTQEFLREVRVLLAADGVIAANTFSSSRLYDSESATYSSVFGRFFNLESENRVILATAGPLPTRESLRSNADAIEAQLRPLGTGRDSLLPKFSPQVQWPPGTRVLTDQYSPGNLLNGAGR